MTQERASSLLRWSTVGEGPPLVLLPGAGCGPAVWGDLPARLARQHTVHITHVAGFGDEPPHESPTLARAIDELAARLAHLGPAALLGHSLGGTVALAAALERPVRAVLLVESAPHLAPLAYGPDAAIQRRRAEELVERARDPLGFSVGLAQSFASMLARAEAHRGLLEEAARSHPPTVAALTRDAMQRDLRPRLSELGAPLHLALGAWSGARGAEDRNEAFLEQTRPHLSRASVLAGCRHFPMVEAPEAFAAWTLGALSPEPETEPEMRNES